MMTVEHSAILHDSYLALKLVSRWSTTYITT